MDYAAMKLVYSEGRPQWLMPDGSFLPAKLRNDGSPAQGRLYVKDRSTRTPRLVRV